MAYITGLTTRGRVTIPKAIRDQFGWQPADKIHFRVEDGEVKLEKVSLPPGNTPSGAPDIDTGIAGVPDIRRLEP